LFFLQFTGKIREDPGRSRRFLGRSGKIQEVPPGGSSRRFLGRSGKIQTDYLFAISF